MSAADNIISKNSPMTKQTFYRLVIVVADMISEAPLSASAPHEICLDKMLVDLYCDKLISSAYSKSEYPEVLKQAMETYHIEPTKMMRYARRRGREDELKKILEEIEDAEA